MTLDRFLFERLHSLGHRSKGLDRLIVFAATWLFYLQLLIAIAFLAEGSVAHVLASVRIFTIALLAVLVAEAISWTTSIFWHRERPFERLKFVPLVWMPPHWKSFPSDHTTIGCTIALTFLFLGHPLGALLLVSALVVGLARVIAGVHYPSDVLAGFLLALFSASAVVILTARTPFV